MYDTFVRRTKLKTKFSSKLIYTNAFTRYNFVSIYINRFISIIQRPLDTTTRRSYFRGMYNIKITAKKMQIDLCEYCGSYI